MKTIEIPQDLLKLPFPWNVPHNGTRSDYINVLDKDKRMLKEALVVLKQLLSFLSQHQEPESKLIPEEMTEYWNFTASAISRDIPTLEDFNVAKIKKKFRLSKIESPSEMMIEEASQKWIWTVTRDIADSILSWLEETMDDCQDAELVEKYLAMVSHYWQSSIPDGLITSLVATSKWIAGEKAIPLLEEIEQNSQDKELADLARDFKRLMIDPNYG